MVIFIFKTDDGISVVIHKNPQHATSLKKQTSNSAKNDPKSRKRPASLANGGPLAAQARTKFKMMKTESVLDNVHRPEMEEKVESIPLPSTVLTMFDKTKEQEVGLQNSLYLGANSIPLKKERVSAHNNRVKCT